MTSPPIHPVLGVSVSPELEKEYQKILPLCELFANELVRQLRELISQHAHISSEFILQHRIKRFDSIFHAIQNKSLTVKSVRDFDDLIGLRVILTFKREADFVCQLIRESLQIIDEEDIQAKLSEREFGYSSVHLIIEPPADWQNMPTFKKVSGFRAEIQIRTVAQHIWASASHILQYKQEQSVPPPVRRAINRVSALLEMADLEFERVLTERASYVVNVNTASTSDELNVDLIAKILEEQLPPENKSDEEEPYATLLPELLHFSINTPQKLRDLLSRHRSYMEAEQVRNLQRCTQEIARGQIPTGCEAELVKQGIYFTHAGFARIALRNEVGKKWEEYINSTKRDGRGVS